MKPIIMGFVLMIAAIAAWCPIAQAASNPTVYLDGRQLYFDVPAQIINGRTMVPMRRIFEEFNASVSWDDNTQTVEANKDSVWLEITIGSSTYCENGTVKTLDVPAQIINGRTLVPLRLIAESMRCKVDYNGGTNVVTISSNSISQPANVARFDDFEILEHYVAYWETPDDPEGMCYSYEVTLTVRNTGNTTWQDDYSYELSFVDGSGIGANLQDENVLPGATYVIHEEGSSSDPISPVSLLMSNPTGYFGDEVVLLESNNSY